MVDGWWGAGDPPSNKVSLSDSIVKFTVAVSNSTLDDLERRLSQARLPESIGGTMFHYGIHS